MTDARREHPSPQSKGGDASMTEIEEAREAARLIVDGITAMQGKQLKVAFQDEATARYVTAVIENAGKVARALLAKSATSDEAREWALSILDGLSPRAKTVEVFIDVDFLRLLANGVPAILSALKGDSSGAVAPPLPSSAEALMVTALREIRTLNQGHGLDHVKRQTWNLAHHAIIALSPKEPTDG